MDSYIAKPLRSNHIIEALLPLPVYVHLCGAVKLSFLRMLSGVSRWIIEVVGILFAIVSDSLWVIFPCGHSLELAIIPNIVVR